MNMPYMMNPNFTTKVILSASRTSHCLILRTWDCKHRWSKHLYIAADALERWLHGEHTERFLDDDMDTIARFYYGSGDEVHVEIMWLHDNSAAELTGYKQTFYVPASFLVNALAMDSGCYCRCLGDTCGRIEQSRLVFSRGANEQISQMTEQERNTLRKALRRVFTYGRKSVIHLYPEYGVDFFFREESTGLCGGLLMNKTMVHGKDHKLHAKHHYSVHT